MSAGAAAPHPETVTEPGRTPALAEPETAVGAGWTALLAVANLGLWMGYFGPLQVLLPNQAEAIAPADKELVLGLVTGVGAAVAVVTGPLVGALSDRTTLRWGRRRPWVLVGTAAGAGGLVLLAGQTTAIGMVLGWCLAQAGLNTLQTGLTAVVPDRVPVRQRATVSGWIGAPQSLGVVVAVLLVTAVVTGIRSGYLLIAGVVVALALPFVLATPDVPLPGSQRPVWSTAEFLRGFRLQARQRPDFAWAWLTRFLVQLGNALATLYLLYYVRDQVRFEQVFPGHRAEEGLLVLILAYTAAAVVSTVVGGVISDRSGKRKPWVIASGLISAAPAALLALWPSWPVVVAAAVLLGIGFGAYMSVDQALVTQVLPTAHDRARDLGLVNIANSAPQVLGPVLAAPLVTLGGYPTLYLAVAAVTVAGAVLVRRIRSVS